MTCNKLEVYNKKCLRGNNRLIKGKWERQTIKKSKSRGTSVQPLKDKQAQAKGQTSPWLSTWFIWWGKSPRQLVLMTVL